MRKSLFSNKTVNNDIRYTCVQRFYAPMTASAKLMSRQFQNSSLHCSSQTVAFSVISGAKWILVFHSAPLAFSVCS